MSSARPPGFEHFPWEPRPPTFSSGQAVSVGIGALTTGAFLISSDIRGGNFMNIGFVAVFAIFISLIGFGLIPERPPRRGFRYINATVMTRAEAPTADSWVYLAPTRPVRLAMTLAWTWAALVMGAFGVYALLVLFGVLPIVFGDASNGGYLLALIPIWGIAIATGWLATLLIGRHIRRSGNFGVRPSGVALGETSVAVNLPGRDVEIPWAQIKSVTTQRLMIGEGADSSSLLLTRRRRGENIDLIRLTLYPGGAITAKEQLLSATGYEVPVDALYSALRWYHANPGSRWELGRVEGQERLAGWKEFALTSGAASS